jgi:hypothetical protein
LDIALLSHRRDTAISGHCAKIRLFHIRLESDIEYMQSDVGNGSSSGDHNKTRLPIRAQHVTVTELSLNM